MKGLHLASHHRLLGKGFEPQYCGREIGLLLTVLRPLRDDLCLLLGVRATSGKLRNMARFFSCWGQHPYDHYCMKKSV